MDEIKTNFDQIMEQFPDDIFNAVPRKLSYEYVNDSFEISLPKKRKYSPDKNETVAGSKTNDKSIDKNSSFDISIINASPWESRRMKADLLEAKTHIAKLKQEIEQQHTIRSNMEIMYNNKVSALKEQCDFTSNKCLDMEKHLSALRKRESSTKTELVKTKNQLNENKQEYEDRIYKLEKENSDLDEKYRLLQNRSSNEVNEYKRHLENLEMQFNLTKDELEGLREIHAEYKEKASMYNDLKLQFEAEQQQHELSKSKIKELEYEIASYGEWKEMAKNSHARLTNLPDLENELIRLRQENKNIRDSLGNKMLLEEQVFDMKTRLEKYEHANTDTVSLKVQINTLEQELVDWKQIARDHCSQNASINPITLRSRIEQILQKDLILTSEKGCSKNEKDSIQVKMQELQTQNDIYTKSNGELKTILKHHKGIILRVQKKLLRVAKERDFYKQLADNFEKEFTITGALADTLNPDSQLRARLDMLEKTLSGYKDMCANLENELASIKTLPEIPLEMQLNTDNYDDLKKEIEYLRVENDRLKRRKEELELEMEHRCLKGDFNIDKSKVVHMQMNPATEAYENSKNELDKLHAEIERLKRRNRKLEDDHEELTRMNDTTNLTINLKEMNTLRSKLESMESKMQHMKELYKSASLEFREVCYMLFGYRMDRVGNTNYRISSMYAESDEEYLNFRLNESGILDMLETDYSISLGDMMRSHLEAHNSLPAFLSTLTIELFNRTTSIILNDN